MITQTETHVKYGVYHSFDDACFSPGGWNDLVEKAGGHVFMTWHYQKVWWEVFGRGKLLIIAVFEKDTLTTIAPLFADEGMIYFVGSGGSDYLHFIGNVSDIDVLGNMLHLAMEEVEGFLGFLFYHIPVALPFQDKLQTISKKFGWDFFIEEEQIAPAISINNYPRQANEAVNKKSLVRHEAWFKRNGILTIQHLTKTSEILPWLETFFDQHRQRWAATTYPSLFNDARQCLFFTRLTEVADASNWLRFTVVLFNDNPVAFHFGFTYNESFLWYKPTFDISMAKQSPGEVLLKQLLTYAIDNGVANFDFGLGNEAFKQRFATHNSMVQNIGLYPSKSFTKESV